MFNLLMQGMPWGAGRDIVILSRLFEHTDDEIVAMFKDGDKILLDKLIQQFSFPASLCKRALVIRSPA
jgi:hypothetical protein